MDIVTANPMVVLLILLSLLLPAIGCKRSDESASGTHAEMSEAAALEWEQRQLEVKKSNEIDIDIIDADNEFIKGDYVGAHRLFQAIASKAPDRIYVWAQCASTAFFAKKSDQECLSVVAKGKEQYELLSADEQFRQGEDYTRLLQVKGWIQLRQDDFAAARETGLAMIQADGESYRGYKIVALADERMDNLESARQHAQKAIKLGGGFDTELAELWKRLSRS